MTVILFDIDGTLVRTGGAGKVAMEAALQEEFGVEKMIDSVPYSGRTDRAIGRDLLTVHGIEPNEANRQKLHEGYLNRLPDALQAKPGVVCPGIEPLLNRLRTEEKLFLGLLTGNVRRGAAAKLSFFGLWDYFVTGGFGDDHFDRDDVARSALAAVQGHLQSTVDPNQVWVIGDTPLDVSCARAIGAKAIAVATGWHSYDELAESQPDLCLPDLSDYESLMGRWLA